MQTFKLYVGTTNNDAKLLEYLYSNIKPINQMGVKLSISHLKKRDMSSQLVEALSRKGIARLPVLLADNKKFVGRERIMKLFKTNLSNFAAPARASAPMPPPPSTGDPISSYMMDVIQEDDDEEDNESEDMMRKYADAATGRGKDEAQRPSSALDNMRNEALENTRNNTQYGNYDDSDNIASDDIMSSLNRTADPGAADAAMEAAYWENQTSSEDLLSM